MQRQLLRLHPLDSAHPHSIRGVNHLLLQDFSCESLNHKQMDFGNFCFLHFYSNRIKLVFRSLKQVLSIADWSNLDTLRSSLFTDQIS